MLPMLYLIFPQVSPFHLYCTSPVRTFNQINVNPEVYVTKCNTNVLLSISRYLP